MSAEGTRPPWQEFKQALAATGFHPSRRLGQNFLLDGNMARAIASDAALESGAFVLEVGPGCGFLSVHLAAAGVQLFAVEVDERLARVAKGFLADYPRAEVLHADVLAGKHELAPAVEAGLPTEGDWHLVSNLPYGVSAPVLALLAGRANPPRSMTVLVQREVAERIACEPGSSAFGPLTVALQIAYEARIVRVLGPELFWPRPKVDSAVVRLERRSELLPVEERERVRKFAARVLRARRKTLQRVLTDTLAERRPDLSREEARVCAAGVLEETSIAGERRAETLSITEFRTLSRVAEGG